ncbi:MAG: sulfite exporter TauE/SafE family protein [Gemmataceae bacterium]|nr:sulfite exporter TauE/SafE family protein [Gemmataceae bacterium]
METIWLCLAAVAAGAVNAIAGGGTLLTFPALEAFGPAHFANGTSTVALFPGSFASMIGYRDRLGGCKRWIIWLTPPSVLGGSLGVFLIEENSFRALVPFLILTAAILFMLQPAIARWVKQPVTPQAPTGKTLAVVVGIQFVIGIYGGYFGAGIGILMLSSLSFLGLKDVHQTNALKTLLAFGINMSGAIMIILRGFVVWDYALAMMVAAIIGGYLGARLSLKLKPAVVRTVIIVIGFGLSAYYFAKGFWF